MYLDKKTIYSQNWSLCLTINLTDVLQETQESSCLFDYTAKPLALKTTKNVGQASKNIAWALSRTTIFLTQQLTAFLVERFF